MKNHLSKISLAICVIIFVCCAQSLYSQTATKGEPKKPVKGMISSEEVMNDEISKKKSKKSKRKPPDYNYHNNVFLGGGIGIGFFYPSGVNDYIKDYMNFHNISLTDGFSEIILNIVFRLNLVYRLNNYLDFQTMLEYGWGPKYIVVTGGGNEYFNFSRVSPGLLVNGHLPLGKGKHSLFIGAGIIYHMMEFEEFTDDVLGYRAQAGINFRFGKLNMQAFLAYDYAKGEGSGEINNNLYKLDMNYSGVVIGVNLMFGL